MKNEKTYLLGMTEIPDNHVVMMVRSQVKGFTDSDGNYFEPIPMESAINNVELIDKLLIISKNYRLINKRRGLKSHLKQVISNHLGHQCDNLNIKGK